MTKIVDLGFRVSLIELMDLGKAERTGAYVLDEEELTIIETSASPSIPYLLEGLKALGVSPTDVKNIIVTHIHLDHAGGVGLFLEHCPNARVFVHPRGRRHLADPSKLMLGAREVYGEDFDRLFHPILPVPEDKLMAMEDGDSLQIGENRTLTFMDTPGHAKHHFSIFDSLSNGVFTGDTIGIFYPQLFAEGFEFYLPSTSPNQFDPEMMLKSAERIENLQLDRIYFGHFGVSLNPPHVFEQLRFWLPKFTRQAEQVWIENPNLTFTEKTDILAQSLTEMVTTFMKNNNAPHSQDAREMIQLDLKVSAMGLIDFLDKKHR